MSHERSQAAAEAASRCDEFEEKREKSRQRRRCGAQIPSIVLVLCLPAFVSAQIAEAPLDVLQMKMRSLNERIHPCKNEAGVPYTTNLINDRCMETEKVVIDSQKRMLAFCQVRATGLSETGQVVPCPKGICRNTILKDVFQAESAAKIIEEANYYVFKKRQIIRECVFATDVAYLRNEDFLNVIQDAIFGDATPGICSLVADKLCTALGGDPRSMTELPSSECCAISELPDSWTIESPELFEAWCGSGFKFGNEQCDDGDLVYECNEDVFVCPPVTPGEPSKALRDNDGCNSFCEIETSFGWGCTPGAQIGGSGGPTPDKCVCNCDCDFKCTCQDFKQRQACRVDAFGIQTDAEDPDIQIQCCDAL